ncbi:MAG: HAD-IA family hydrolase [Halothiobacillaceae bacterium]|nr:HAD-IA family hydrolase [Halothiobacillaceae bacterium]HER34411.1 HAD family hydrolase [Halothiobacillaceae bacterium]
MTEHRNLFERPDHLYQRPRLVVFDWDGTLADSTGRIVNAFQEALNEVDHPPLADDTIRGIIGLSLANAIAELFPEASDAFREKLARTYHQRYFANEEPVALYPEASALLDSLHEDGCLLAVATGKSRRGLDRALAQTGTADYFHHTLTAEETRSKPHPAMLEGILAYTGSRPGETWMVGDTDFDLLMGRNAGTQVVGITHGAHPLERLTAARPDWVVERLSQLHDGEWRPAEPAARSDV